MAVTSLLISASLREEERRRQEEKKGERLEALVLLLVTLDWKEAVAQVGV